MGRIRSRGFVDTAAREAGVVAAVAAVGIGYNQCIEVVAAVERYKETAVVHRPGKGRAGYILHNHQDYCRSMVHQSIAAEELNSYYYNLGFDRIVEIGKGIELEVDHNLDFEEPDNQLQKMIRVVQGRLTVQ